MFVQIYSNIFPSRIRSLLYKCDLTYLIICTRSFRSIVPKHMKREVNQYCVRMAVYIAIMCAPIKTLASLLETDLKSLMVESSHFASIFLDLGSGNRYFSGLPMDVWKPNKVLLQHQRFNPLKENGIIGSQPTNDIPNLNVGDPMEHKQIWNASFNYRLLLTGCYVIGISYPNLIQRIKCRPEFFTMVPDDYPPLTEEEAEHVRQLESVMT